MKAFVTGGSGFLGSALVKKLLKENWEVTYTCRNPKEELHELGASWLNCDIRDFEKLSTGLKGHDIVFHVAAKTGIWGDYKEYREINVDGTQNIIQACEKNHIRYLVYTGSPSCVFSRNSQENIDETIPYPEKFLNPYSFTKAEAEKLALTSSLKCVSLRPHLIWGPGDTNIIPRLIEKSQKGKLIQIGNGDNLVDVVYIDNAVQAHFLAGKKLLEGKITVNQPFFITQDQPVNLWDFINQLLIELKLPVIGKRIPFNFAYQLGSFIELLYKTLKKNDEPPLTRFLALQMGKSHYYSKKLSQDVLGYFPEISTEEGIRRVGKYFISHLPLSRV